MACVLHAAEFVQPCLDSATRRNYPPRPCRWAPRRPRSESLIELRPPHSLRTVDRCSEPGHFFLSDIFGSRGGVPCCAMPAVVPR
jgi:hypothetical protein